MQKMPKVRTNDKIAPVIIRNKLEVVAARVPNESVTRRSSFLRGIHTTVESTMLQRHGMPTSEPVRKLPPSRPATAKLVEQKNALLEKDAKRLMGKRTCFSHEVPLKHLKISLLVDEVKGEFLPTDPVPLDSRDIEHEEEVDVIGENVPASVLEKNLYLQHLRDKTVIKPIVELSQPVEPVLRAWNEYVENLPQNAEFQSLPECNQIEIFKAFVNDGIDGANQFFTEKANAAKPLDDVPPPSGAHIEAPVKRMIHSAPIRRPKMMYDVAEKLQHLEQLKDRESSSGQNFNFNSVERARDAAAKDLQIQNTAKNVFSSHYSFHLQKRQIEMLKSKERGLDYMANIRRKHSAKLRHPLLARRTLPEGATAQPLKVVEIAEFL